MIKDYFLFLKNPTPPANESIHIKNDMLTIIKIYLLTLCFTFVAALVCALLDQFLLTVFSIKLFGATWDSNTKQALLKLGKYKLLYIALIVPIMEELIFRLPLKTKESYIAFSIGLLAYSLTGHQISHFNFYSFASYFTISIFLIFIPMILSWIFKKLHLIEVINRNYKLYFYMYTTLFALVHIPNYAPLNYKLIYLYPIFVLPQFIAGLSLGYIRNKCGLPYSILLHSLINLPHCI